MEKKRILAILVCALALMAIPANAQRTPVEKYPQAPSVFYQAFLDYVQDFPSCRMTVGNGQYIGQLNLDKALYGFGAYNDDSGCRVGFFRNGAYEFGIAITQSNALVGSETEYVAYSLATGRIDYLVRGGQRVTLDPAATTDYGFVHMNYANGDRYIGEIYQGQRHGFGLYYYAKGGYWFGQYDKGVCQGPGCLFRDDCSMRIGYYQYGFEQRMREVLPFKK